MGKLMFVDSDVLRHFVRQYLALRNEAQETMKTSVITCEYCANSAADPATCREAHGNCYTCKLRKECACFGCGSRSENFIWRGAVEANMPDEEEVSTIISNMGAEEVAPHNANRAAWRKALRHNQAEYNELRTAQVALWYTENHLLCEHKGLVLSEIMLRIHRCLSGMVDKMIITQQDAKEAMEHFGTPEEPVDGEHPLILSNAQNIAKHIAKKYRDPNAE